jgi:hypothetical protein
MALCVAVDPTDTRRVFCGLSGGGLHLSENGGATWQSTGTGMNPAAWVADIVFDPTDAQRMYAADRFSGVYMSTDGGRTWLLTTNGLRTRDVNALAVTGDGLHVYAGTEGEGVFRLDTTGQEPPAASDDVDEPGPDDTDDNDTGPDDTDAWTDDTDNDDDSDTGDDQVTQPCGSGAPIAFVAIPLLCWRIRRRTID